MTDTIRTVAGHESADATLFHYHIHAGSIEERPTGFDGCDGKMVLALNGGHVQLLLSIRYRQALANRLKGLHLEDYQRLRIVSWGYQPYRKEARIPEQAR